jgi:hypothetical protein
MYDPIIRISGLCGVVAELYAALFADRTGSDLRRYVQYRGTSDHWAPKRSCGLDTDH